MASKVSAMGAVAYVAARRKSPLFPSMRLLLATLLCSCFIALSVSSSNIAVALICMTSCPVTGYTGQLHWSADEEGLVFAAQNAGSLLMLATGALADRLNSKWMIGLSVGLSVLANLAVPLTAPFSFWFAVLARLLVGASDACLQPSVNSLITRWFPQSERAAVIGFVTGGRQIGTLFILPTAGYLCTRRDILGGWPSIFYLSATIGCLVGLFWLPISADKPSKQPCISVNERLYIETRVSCESLGKRRHRPPLPFRTLFLCRPLWAGIFALICHEWPLVIMLQFLPNYLRDVLAFTPAQNGLASALPIGCLWLSKTLSSSLASFIAAKTKRSLSRTTIVKMFNAVASAGLAICVAIVPMFGRDEAVSAIVALCLAMIFAGCHTPGVQTALVQLAPAFTGVITGLSFFFVALFGIANKLITKSIVQTGSETEWRLVFESSAIIAVLPVIVFTIWGSAERQQWAATTTPKSSAVFALASNSSFDLQSAADDNEKPEQ